MIMVSCAVIVGILLGYFTKSEDGALSITDELITAVVDEAHTL